MTSKTMKTILFASLIAAMILPFSAMDFADAEKPDKKIKEDVEKKTSKVFKAKSENTKHGDKTYKEFVPKDMKKHSFFDVDLTEMRNSNNNHKAIPLIINGETVVAKLTPNRLSDSDTEVNTFKGRIIGEPNSDVRIFINEYQVAGHVNIDDKYYYIEPLRKLDDAAPDTAYVVYEQEDESIKTSLTSWNISLIPEVSASTTKTLNLITDCDQEYKDLYTWYSTQWKDEQMMTLNGMSSLYDDVYIDINVVSQDSCTNDGGTYSSTNLPTIRTEVKSLWSSNNQFDLVHMFSGKDLYYSGQSNSDWYKGISSIGGVSNSQQYGYSVSQHLAEVEIGYLALQSQKELLVAHEIGHSFGGSHTYQGIQHWWGTEDTVMHDATTWFGSMKWSDYNESTVEWYGQNYL